MKSKVQGMKKTAVKMFVLAYMSTLTVMMIAAALLITQWNSIYAEFKKDHLQDALIRITDEIKKNQIHPPLSPQEQAKLTGLAKREGVLIRLIGADKKLHLDTMNPGPLQADSMTVQIRNLNNIWEEVTLVWARDSEAAYPGYSLTNKFHQSVASGLLVCALIAIPLSLLIVMLVLKPFDRVMKAMNEILQKRMFSLIEEKGRGDALKITKGINYLVQQLNEQEKWRKLTMEDLAHELRTPLMLVSNQIEAINDGVFEPDPFRMEKIYSDLSRLTRLVNDIERIIQAQSARFELRLEEIDMVPVIKQAIGSLEESYTSKNMQIDLNTPKVPCPIYVDVDKMTQVFVNILYNAIKYTPINGRIEISIEPDFDAGHIVVALKDNGIGMPQEELPKIFERFYRIDKSRTRETAGSGLGLTITKRLVEAHNGEIKVWSKPGIGSVFTVIIPSSTF